MYNSKPHQEHDLGRLHQHMLHTRLAMLVSHGEQGLLATHLPVLVDTDEGEFGTVYGHLARANRQWQDLAQGGEALLVFPAPTPMSAPAFTRARPITPRWCPPGTTWRCTPGAR
jgi:transcriptional regulator